MIEMKTEVTISRISGRSICNFMLYCTDEQYQKWWPGTHIAFHTTKRFPDNLGNQVYFDEYVGKRRVRLRGVVAEIIPGTRIVWQMKSIVKLPAWLILEFNDTNEGIVIAHTLQAGFEGIGILLDPLLRLLLNRSFERDMQEHAQIEFYKLAEMLA